MGNENILSLRCIRCGKLIQGLAQLCAECSADEEQASIFLPGQVVPSPAEITTLDVGMLTSPSRCRSCGQFVTMTADFCPACGRAVGPGVREYAGFWIRLGATVIDAVILLMVQFVLALLISETIGLIFMEVLLGSMYTIGFWLAEGATPGKLAFGIRVEMADGTPLTLTGALLRYVCYIPSGFFLLGYILIGVTREKRGLHDFLAGTVVVKTR
jgi:uncharacterized RDD family membrane protein YckC